MKMMQNNQQNILLIDKHERIASAGDLFDHITDAMYYHGCTSVVVHESSLGESFFDLKTGVAGEILQKCSTYSIKIAIVGDFSKYGGKSLKAFIHESNNGNGVFFKQTVEQGIFAISGQEHP